MASYKVFQFLALLISCLSTNAQFFFQPFRPNNPHGSNHPIYRPTWTSNNRDFYEFSPSEQYSSYSSFPKSYRDSLISESRFERPVDFFVPASTKKIPIEDKNFKKAISPVYTITEKDSEKYKNLVLKSGVPYCEEVRGKRSADGKETKDDESMVCYKCKNPKGGEIYEQCVYVQEPAAKSSSSEEKFAPLTNTFRPRRSNPESHEKSSEQSNFGQEHKNKENPYRFSEDVFADLSQEIPVEYKNKDENCERVVKDTMVCMVCEDKKTNGKYEQCSYVRQPTKKAYSYTTSSSSKDPEKEGKKREEEKSQDSGESGEESKPIKEERRYSYPENKYHEESKDDKRAEASQNEESTGDCKRVQKGSQSCMVCKDSKSGDTYEKCSYTYQPTDKVYKFSKSKSFGQPRDSSSNEEKNSDEKKESYASGEHIAPQSKYTRDYYFPTSFYGKDDDDKSRSPYAGEKPSADYRRPAFYDFQSASRDKETSPSSPYVKSESEAISEKIDPSNCKKVQKDSMLCNICKDPKTGNDFERCSYSSQPNDKSYSYTKSRSFGSPSKSETQSGYSGDNSKESREYPYNSERSYQFPSQSKSYVPASDTRREYREYPIVSETKTSPKEEPAKNKSDDIPKPSEMSFYDTLKKKAEIEKFLQEFQKEDRSNCKKVMRDKMTCYQCVDKNGFQKEECAFVTSQDPSKDKVAYREVKEFQAEPRKKVPRSTTISRVQRRIDNFYLEPSMSASEDSPVKMEAAKPREEKSEDPPKNSKDAVVHDFADETRPVYDKVLGLSLPAYMLQISEHEAEFDEVVASSRY